MSEGGAGSCSSVPMWWGQVVPAGSGHTPNPTSNEIYQGSMRQDCSPQGFIPHPIPLFSGDTGDQLRASPPLLSAIKETDAVVQVGDGKLSTLSHNWCEKDPEGAEPPYTLGRDKTERGYAEQSQLGPQISPISCQLASWQAELLLQP